MATEISAPGFPDASTRYRRWEFTMRSNAARNACRTMLRTRMTIAVIAVAVVLPGSALALHAPLDKAYSPSPTATDDKPVNLLRDGKYAPAPTTASGGTQVARVIRPGGFDFRAAGIGAAVGALALAMVGGVVIARFRHRDAAPAPRTAAS